MSPTSARFADDARFRFAYDIVVEAEPADVFNAFVEPSLFARWFPDLRSATWLGDGRQGLGAVREVRLKGLSVREHFTHWEPGEGFAFYLSEISAPIISAMVERVELTPTAAGTRVEWTIAYRPKIAVRPLHPLLRPVFSRMFGKAAKRLQQHFARP